MLCIGYCANCIEKYGDYLYFLFRVLIGLLFSLHGGQKLFGWFGGVAGDGASVTLASLMGAAGIIEFAGGIAVAVGFFSRAVATIAAIEMLVAFFMVHVPQGWVPLLNQGEAALLYFSAFLVVIVYGNQKWSLEQKLLGKEVF